MNEDVDAFFRLIEQLKIGPSVEAELVWLAVEAFLTPLPPGITTRVGGDGEIEYRDCSTGRVSRTHPAVEHYVGKARPGPDTTVQITLIRAQVIEERAKLEPLFAERARQPLSHAWFELPRADGPIFVDCVSGQWITTPPERLVQSIASGAAEAAEISRRRNEPTVEGRERRRAHGPSQQRPPLTASAVSLGLTRTIMGDSGPSATTPFDITALSFSSWWREGTGMTVQRRTLTIEFDLATRQFAVALDGDDKIYTISHIVDRTGRHLQEWDLHVGAQIDVLGRMTTLKKASSATVLWNEAHWRRLRRLEHRLQVELTKYDPRAKRPEINEHGASAGAAPTGGAHNLRRILLRVDSLRQQLAEFRPRLAGRIMQESLEQAKATRPPRVARRAHGGGYGPVGDDDEAAGAQSAVASAASATAAAADDER